MAGNPAAFRFLVLFRQFTDCSVLGYGFSLFVIGRIRGNSPFFEVELHFDAVHFIHADL